MAHQLLHNHPVNHSWGCKCEWQRPPTLPSPTSMNGSVVATNLGCNVANADLYNKAFIGAAVRDVSLLNEGQ